MRFECPVLHLKSLKSWTRYWLYKLNNVPVFLLYDSSSELFYINLCSNIHTAFILIKHVYLIVIFWLRLNYIVGAIMELKLAGCDELVISNFFFFFFLNSLRQLVKWEMADKFETTFTMKMRHFSSNECLLLKFWTLQQKERKALFFSEIIVSSL